MSASSGIDSKDELKVKLFMLAYPEDPVVWYSSGRIAQKAASGDCLWPRKVIEDAYYIRHGQFVHRGGCHDSSSNLFND
jgi:hypothetical protein